VKVQAIGLAALVGAGCLAGAPAAAWSPGDLFKPCEGDCAVAIYSGVYIQDSLTDLWSSPSFPWDWDYASDDHLIATTVSRVTWEFWRHWTMEPEFGIGQRYGRESATEIWGAFFFRYHGFPWDRHLLTTVAISTGLNWASEITDVERDRANDGEGSQVMHFFAPEVTFALPSHPNTELMIRIHHRSGVFGLVSDAFGGAQYATVGLRFRF
jgi:hypothetical protein